MKKKLLLFMVSGLLAMTGTVWGSEGIFAEEMESVGLEAQQSVVEGGFSDGDSEEGAEREAESDGMILGAESEEETVLVEDADEEAETMILDATEEVEEEITIETGSEITSETDDTFTDTGNSVSIAEKESETAAVGASSYSSDGFTYEVSGTPAEATITGYTESANIVIPSYLGGYKVTAIASDVFKNSEMTSLTIPETITSIGDGAFYNCEKLSNIQFNAVNCGDCYWWEGGTFYNAGATAGSLTVTFGSGVKRIPGRLFYVNDSTYYARVTAVIMSDSIEEIGDSAFKNCQLLGNVTWGSGIVTIGRYAFENCVSMTLVIIPEPTKSIGNSAFYNCEELTGIQFNATNCGDCEYYDKTFYNAGASASSLSVTFGSNVKRIPAYMFYVYGVDYNYGDNRCAHITSVTLTDSIQEIGTSAFERCYFLNSVVWGNGIKEIGSNAFNRCIAITSVEIPASVTEIGKGAFYYCWNLETIIYNAKSCADCSYYSNVFWYAGAKASSLTVTVGSSVKKIPAYLFYTDEAYNYGDGYYAHITSVTLPSGLDKIGECSFANCYDLKTVTVNGKNTTFDDDAFANCSSSLVFKCPYGSTAGVYATQNGFKYSYTDYTVEVKVSATKIISLKNNKSKKITVKWKKVSKASGYQIQYSKNKKFSSGVKTKTIKNRSTTSVTLSKLTKKKKYYVRVRAYIKSGGTTYYSSWSKVKSVRVKK